MAPEDLEWMAARLALRYYSDGERLLAPQDGPVAQLYIVQRGRVDGVPATFPSFHEKAFTLAPGEMFPVGALIGRRPSTVNYEAAGDTFCYLLGADDFHALRGRSPAFQAFCTQRLAKLLEESAREVRGRYAGRAEAELGMQSALRTAIRRPAVTMPAEASVRSVLEVMKAKRIGSMVLTAPDGQPQGIFTHTDVLDRVALADLDLEAPISNVMTPDPVALAGEVSVAEAAQLMARKGFRHLLVVDGNRLEGVVSERDLFVLQRRSAQGLRKEIARAETREWLAFAARDASGLAGNLLAQGVGAEPLMQLVTALNDAIAVRAVELASRSRGVGDIAFCWIGLGSEGRMEQTLATDQDNAIIFPDEAPDGTKERLLAFAAEVNDTLAECGFPLCKGDIMARNPRWCLKLGEWKERFDDWMRNSHPEALLNAAIFFDFRPLAGNVALAEELRRFLQEQGASRPVFLRQMAVNALEVRPPIGFFSDIAVDASTGGRIDLKLQASRPFVDCARILALAAGVAETNTAARLRAAAPVLRMAEGEVEATVQAFYYVQMLRLRHQVDGSASEAAEERNRVDPEALNPLDRRILKEALRQARKLQNRVALDYRL